MLGVKFVRACHLALVQSFFAKSPTVYEDMKKLHAKTGHGLFVKLKTALIWWPKSDNQTLIRV